MIVDSVTEQHRRKAEETEQDLLPSERGRPALPFASEGLEQLRDSHC